MAGKLRLHVKNNRAGEAVFRMTSERVDAALARNSDIETLDQIVTLLLSYGEV